MIRAEEARLWFFKFHEQNDPIHAIELGILHSATEGKPEFKWECGSDMVERAGTNRLTRDDLRILLHIKNQGYQDPVFEGSHMTVRFA